jgi:hypothetical protein
MGSTQSCESGGELAAAYDYDESDNVLELLLHFPFLKPHLIWVQHQEVGSVKRNLPAAVEANVFESHSLRL